MTRTRNRFIPQSPAARAGVALILGFGLGIALAKTSSPVARSIADWLEAIGTMWVNAIRMTVIPLVVSLLVATIVRDRDLGGVGRMGRRALAIFVVQLVIIGVIGLAIAPPLFARINVDPASAAALRAAQGGVSTQMPTFTAWFVSLVPTNPFKAAADGAILPLIVFALLLAMGLSRTPKEVRDPGALFFASIAEAVIVIVKWILALAPVGIFALAVPLAMHVGAGLAGAAALYVAIHSGMLIVILALFYPAAGLAGVPIRQFARAVLPAQLVAFSTRSSVAALPVLIEGAERVLAIPTQVASFALPFGVSLARVNSSASWVACAAFVAKLYGVPVSFAQFALLCAMSIPMSFSVPGIPSAGLFVIAPAFMAIGVPVEGIGILIALDAIPDIFKTSVNVTAQMSTAVFLTRLEPATESEPVPVAAAIAS